jgi:hypothetical protein
MKTLEEVHRQLGITIDADGNRQQNRKARRHMQKMLRKKTGEKLLPREQRHKCDECKACCGVVPVSEIGLLAFQPCPHLCDHGCGIYANRPMGCKTWNCQWLAEPQWEDKYRPDRCGVIVDIVPDTCGVRNDETGEVIELPAAQFWVLPGHEDDWQDPNSLANNLILSFASKGLAVLWRYRDPGPIGQGARGFWIGDGEKLGELGRLYSIDGGAPTRRHNAIERVEHALNLLEGDHQ